MSHFKIEIVDCINSAGHKYRHPFVNGRAISRVIMDILSQEYHVNPYIIDELPQAFINKYPLTPIDSDYPGQFVTSDHWYTIGDIVSHLQEQDFHVQFKRSPENGKWALFTLDDKQLTPYKYSDFDFIIKKGWDYSKYRRFDGKFIFAKYINEIGKDEYELLDTDCNIIIRGFSKYVFSDNQDDLLYLHFNGYESHWTNIVFDDGATIDEMKAKYKNIQFISFDGDPNTPLGKYFLIQAKNKSGDDSANGTITLSYIRRDHKFNKSDLLFYQALRWNTFDKHRNPRDSAFDCIATSSGFDPISEKYGGGWLALAPGFNCILPTSVFEIENSTRKLEIPAINTITPIFDGNNLVCFYSNLPLTPVESLMKFKELLSDKSEDINDLPF